ncbi:hypothetical protein H0H92_008766 [Tricholoma furcatifolium]|nr:hypothetical protein H0H92_008766 [Tricholoma furcatifolium]
MYGHGLLSQFGLDDNFLHLNHGSFGSLPNPVRSAYNAITEEVERNPDLFIRRHLGNRTREVRRLLATHIGALEDESSTAFSQIKRNVAALGDLPARPILSEFILLFPETHASILDRFTEHIRVLKAKAMNKTIRITALFDTIVSTPGVLMPWKAMVQICNAEGVMSIVDAAHSLGQEKDIKLSDTQPDFWVGNCSKWLYAKRGSGVMNQHLVPNNLPLGLGWFEPVEGIKTMSHFASEFYSLDFRAEIGGEERIITYCHNLAVEGGRCIAEILKTEVMEMSEAPQELIGTMVNVLLPLTNILPSPEVMRALDNKLFERRAYAVIYYHNGSWWTRISAQVYNQLLEISDFEEFGNILIGLCEELGDEFGA